MTNRSVNYRFRSEHQNFAPFVVINVWEGELLQVQPCCRLNVDATFLHLSFRKCQDNSLYDKDKNYRENF